MKQAKNKTIQPPINTETFNYYQIHKPKNHDCYQEDRISKLEARQQDDRNLLQNLNDSIHELTLTIQEMKVLISKDQGKNNEQEFIKGYVISFIISMGVIVLTHLFRL